MTEYICRTLTMFTNKVSLDRQSLSCVLCFLILKVIIIWSGMWFRVAPKTGCRTEMCLKERLDCELKL
jgi:hypothetical protein